jgi:hypothetical protein
MTIDEFGLHYLVHHRNLGSILEHGILPYSAVRARGLGFTDLSDAEVQKHRERRDPIIGVSIHEYVPLYLNPKNAMLYVRREQRDEILILRVSPSVTNKARVLYTDGNAASRATKFSLVDDVVRPSLPVLRSDRWTSFVDGRRRRMAEVLIHGEIQPQKILGAICSTPATAAWIRKTHNIYAVCDPRIYF